LFVSASTRYSTGRPRPASTAPEGWTLYRLPGPQLERAWMPRTRRSELRRYAVQMLPWPVGIPIRFSAMSRLGAHNWSQHRSAGHRPSLHIGRIRSRASEPVAACGSIAVSNRRAPKRYLLARSKCQGQAEPTLFDQPNVRGPRLLQLTEMLTHPTLWQLHAATSDVETFRLSGYRQLVRGRSSLCARQTPPW
jgi:hypothetical protein